MVQGFRQGSQLGSPCSVSPVVESDIGWESRKAEAGVSGDWPGKLPASCSYRASLCNPFAYAGLGFLQDGGLKKAELSPSAANGLCKDFASEIAQGCFAYNPLVPTTTGALPASIAGHLVRLLMEAVPKSPGKREMWDGCVTTTRFENAASYNHAQIWNLIIIY